MVKGQIKVDFLRIFILFLAASGLSCGTQDPLLQRAGPSLRRVGFSLVVACTGLVAPRYVGS